MQKFSILAIILTVFASTTGSLQAQSPSCSSFCEPTCCCGDNCWRPLWSVSAGTAILHRSTPQPSLIAETTMTRTRLLDAGDFNFDWNAGPDIGIVRRVDNYEAVDAIDFRYFGIDSWQANTSVTANTLWRFPLSTGSLPAAQIDGAYRSQLHNIEINLLRDSSYERLTWLAGFRWVRLYEQLDLTVTAGNQAYYTYTTRNNLYGGQIGAIIRLFDRNGPFRIDCSTKAGIYGNATANLYEDNDSFGHYNLLSSDKRNQVAFVGDINFVANYQWTKHIALQGGYQLLWLRGVAIAGDQAVVADYQTKSGILSGGGVFYHGALASINLTW